MIRTTIHPPRHVHVVPGPLLLRGVPDGPGLAAHRNCWGGVPRLGTSELLARLEAAELRGRGGAAFPFARKVATAIESGRRREIVVNAAEGEPASAKDSALLLTVPHQVLDGAEAAAEALGVGVVHVVTGADRPTVGVAVRHALLEREQGSTGWGRRGRVRFLHHEAPGRFVAGQARAVLDLLASGPGLPTTAWVPEAVRGHRDRPTLLSNAETWAHVAAIVRDPAAYLAVGSPHEPGTSLLTLTTPVEGEGLVLDEAVVVEVEHGTTFEVARQRARARGSMGPAEAAPTAHTLLGGFHGMWVDGSTLPALPVSRLALAAHGLALGAGAVMALGEDGCPVAATARIVTYLAEESARRCGPCLNGLPALARQVRLLDAGQATGWRLEELFLLLERRGACAHPDGTVRLVRSLLTTFPDLVDTHASRQCPCQRVGVTLQGARA